MQQKRQNASFKPQGALHVSALLLAILLSPGEQGQTSLLEDGLCVDMAGCRASLVLGLVAKAYSWG